MTKMKSMILNSMYRLHKDEAGQGLVEYVLIVALVAFAATPGMTTLASGLNSAFTRIGSVLGTYIKDPWERTQTSRCKAMQDTRAKQRFMFPRHVARPSMQKLKNSLVPLRSE